MLVFTVVISNFLLLLTIPTFLVHILSNATEKVHVIVSENPKRRIFLK
jgi:hypothetical protein